MSGNVFIRMDGAYCKCGKKLEHDPDTGYYFCENCPLSDKIRDFKCDADEARVFLDNKVIKSDDKIGHPSHYCHGDIECITAIKSALTDEEFRGHVKATMIQYLWREKWKGGDEDILKAIKFADFLDLDKNKK